MKFLALVCLAISFSVSAHAQIDFDACAPVFEACSRQGYSKDDTAAPGKKIWLDCASLIINQKKAVAKVDVDPKGADANYCRDYREARQKFDLDYASKHKRAK